MDQSDPILPGPTANPEVPKGRAITLRDVAKFAGVHPGTASRALNEQRRHLVNRETIERVRLAANHLDFRPDPAARSLKTRRSYTVGVIIPDLNNPLFPPIVRGIEDRLTAAGFVALLGNTDNDDDRERRVFEGMRSRHVDGFILATARRHHPLLQGTRAAEDLAVVLVNRISEDMSLPSVSVNDEIGTRQAVSHLTALGHRRIAHIAGPLSLSTGRGRHQGFLAGMAAAGLTVDDNSVVYSETFSQREGERCCQQLIDSESPFTAVVAGNDLLALGCYAAIESSGLSCPQDISVIGFNDMPFLDRVRPPLTSIRIPHYQLGSESARLILERIDNPQAAVSAVVLAPRLVERGSTSAPPDTAGRRRSALARRAEQPVPDLR